MILRRREATAAAVMLIALSTSLYFLAKPVAPAHADTSATATDITPFVTATCNVDGSSAVQVDLAAFVAAPAAGPVRVMLQIVPSGTTAFAPVTAGNVPTYVTMTTGGTNVLLNGETNPLAQQVVLIEAQGYAPESTTIPACDPAQPAPNYLLPALSNPPATFSATACVGTTPDTYNGTASLTVTVTNPGSPTPAGYTPATYAAAYTAATGLTEIDYGVYITDTSGNILAPTGTGMAQFDLAGDQATGPATTDPTNPASSFTIPSTGQSTDEIWVVGTDGQAATPLALGQLPDCTQVPNTSAVVVAPPASSTPAAPSSIPTTSDPRTSDPSTSSASSTPTLTPTTSVATLPAQTVTSPEVQTSNTPFVENSSTSPTASAIASPLPTPTVSSETISPNSGIGNFTASAEPSSSSLMQDPSASPTVTISGPAAKISVHDTDVASSPSTIKPVQILRWHRDAALVVGFDTLAICSLVGATVWSARRR